MREYRRRIRYNVIPNTPVVSSVVVPNDVTPVIPNVIPKLPGLILQGNKIVGIERQPATMPQEFIPLYNPSLHRTGDKVKMRDRQGKTQVLIVPELDVDGNPIW